MKKLLLILLPILLLTSCASTYEITSEKNDSIKMERHKDILIATARNGFYEDSEYRNSGNQTTNALLKKVRPFALSVDITPANTFKSINKSELVNYDYIIVPELYHWEDRATGINFKPDRVILSLTVYDNSGTLLNYLEIKGRSTYFTLCYNDPIELINEALDKYLSKLFLN